MSRLWTVTFMAEAAEDLDALDGSQRRQVEKAIFKVSKNPLNIVVIAARADDEAYELAFLRNSD
jgi:mRNA-degrading endonuclease RelE of RelBE toxin-antitoxin system